MRSMALRMCIIVVIHAMLGVMLYRARGTSDATWLRSDFTVFYLPAAAACLAYGVVAWKARLGASSAVGRVMAVTLVACAATAVSCWIVLLFAMNLYGS